MISNASNLSFQSLTNEMILNAVESTGLKLSGRLVALNSMENRVYAVELEKEEDERRPKQIVAKFYRPDRWSESELLSEHLMARALCYENIATPKYFPILTEKFQVKCPDSYNDTVESLLLPKQVTLGKTDVFYFCVWEKISGRPPLDMMEDDLAVVGRLIARMHNLFESKLKAETFHRPHFTTASFGMTALENLSACKLIPRPLDIAILGQIEDMLARLSWYDTALNFVPIHGDLHRLNLLQTENEGAFWVVDFDDCVWGPEIHDLWLLASGCHMNEDDPKKAFELALSSLSEGYNELRKLPPDSEILVEPLRTLRMIHYAGWIAKRWSDPLFRDVFSFFTEFSYWERLLNDLENQKLILEQNGLLD